MSNCCVGGAYGYGVGFIHVGVCLIAVVAGLRTRVRVHMGLCGFIALTVGFKCINKI